VEFIPTLYSGQALSLPKDYLAMTGGGRSSLLNIASLPGHCEAISYFGQVSYKVKEGWVEDAESMAIIIGEIGRSQKRNALPLEEVANPIAELLRHCLKDSEGHTLLVVVDENDQVIGFINVFTGFLL